MKRVLIALLWLLLLGAAGVVMLPLLGWAASHKIPRLSRELLIAGAEFGLDLYVLLLFFALLPGTKSPLRVKSGGRAKSGPRAATLGPVQAVWALLGFGAMLAAGGLASYNILIVGNLLLDMGHAGWHADLGSRDAMLAAAFGGEVAAAWWIGWYIGRISPAQVVSAAADGVGWRPARPVAYAAAILCAAVIIAIVGALFHFIPPDMQTLKNLPMARLMQGAGWEVLPLLALILLVGPVVEELTFRGVAFAGFAHRFGPAWASILTTAIFMAVHAGEKLHYLPGFIDVGLVAAAACWLRLKFGSIRPAMLLHVLYNAGLIFAGGMFH